MSGKGERKVQKPVTFSVVEGEILQPLVSAEQAVSCTGYVQHRQGAREEETMGSWEIPSQARLAKQQGVPQEPPIVGHFRPGSWGFQCRQRINIPTPRQQCF